MADDTGHSKSPPYLGPAQTGWNFENQPDISGLVTWEWKIPEDYVYYSPEWRSIVGKPEDPSVQDTQASWWPLVHEEDIEPFVNAAKDIVSGKTEHFHNLFRIRRNDTWVWLLSRGRVTEWRDGEPVRVTGALIDISFLRSDAKFRHGTAGPDHTHLFSGNSPDLTIRMDESLTPVLANPAALAAVYGKKPSDTEITRVDEERMEFLREKVAAVFANGMPIREVMCFPTDYGHDVTGEYAFWPEYGIDGTIEAVMMNFRDLTEIVLAERQARLNQMRLDFQYQLTQMDNAPVEEVLRYVINSLVGLTESASGVIFFPSDAETHSGQVIWSQDHHLAVPEQELCLTSLPEDLAFITEGTDDRPGRLILNGNNLHPVKLFFDGKVSVMRLLSAPIYDGERIAAFVMVYNKERYYTDSDLQQLEAFMTSAWFILRRQEFVRELHRAKELAEKANKIKDEFLANVSHELRTPLHGILSMLDLLGFSSLSEQQQTYLRSAVDSGEALMHIISDILDFSRMESGKMRLRQEDLDIKKAIFSSLELFREEAREKGLDFRSEIDPAIPDRLIGDDARVRQIIFNLVGNALKYTEKGSIEVTCSLLPNDSAEETCIFLTVKDTGIGIDSAMLDVIFQAFSQIETAASRKYQGTGLGLSIVRKLVGMMDGEMRMESELGKGTTVHCSLRFAMPVSGLQSDWEEHTYGHETLPVISMDILVAEDDAVARLAMQMFLEREGHRVVCVENGREALEALTAHPFDCLFTDIRMPVIDGIETLRRIRAGDLSDIILSEKVVERIRMTIPDAHDLSMPLPRKIPVVTVSAHAMVGDRERFLERGMDFYLSKPIVIKELREILRQLTPMVSYFRSGRPLS